MTIKRGEHWGQSIAATPGRRIAANDADLVKMVLEDSTTAISVVDGDLHRSVGSPAPRARMMRAPVDLMRLVGDGFDVLGVGTAFVKRNWWRGRVIAICNTPFAGEWNIAPRAHPNDGLVDIVEIDVDMPIRQRWAVRRRLPTGQHLPHPQITYRRVDHVSWRFDQPMDCFVDGHRIGRTSELTVEIVPDAFELDF